MFKIIKIPGDAANAPEQLGTKFKFWYKNQDGEDCLFKEGREDTGENWAEKIASELCEMLGIPHAKYELCEWRERKGVTTPNFVPGDGRLMHGNELLAGFVHDYPKARLYGVKQHTLRKVMTIMKSDRVSPPLSSKTPGEFASAMDVFMGYLMLDTLISNQDRHHENWGLIYFSKKNKQYLAPTYDHASSLGRNESDARRMQILKSNDPRRNIKNYVKRAASAFYDSKINPRRLKTIEAFWEVGVKRPEIAIKWLDKLHELENRKMRMLMDDLPSTEISETAKEFAVAMIRENKNRLLGLENQLK